MIKTKTRTATPKNTGVESDVNIPRRNKNKHTAIAHSTANFVNQVILLVTSWESSTTGFVDICSEGMVCLESL